jgi:pimeloyl-ACP methyl ester carboxylesterase
MPKIRVRDLDMYYEIHGRSDAEPLVLLHGFTGTGHGFDPFLGQLSEHYRLFVPDWRGHGRTTNPTGNIVHVELARDTAAFAAALGLNRAHFCGFSSGGMHLLFLALDHPHLVHSLTLVSATYTFDDHAKAKVREARDSAQAEWIDSLNASHGETHGANYAHTLLDLWANSVLRPDELPFTPDDLGKITCPTLIMHGDRDDFFPVHIPVTMYQAISKSQLCILPNCHHGLPWEINPALFTSILLDFLTKNPFVDSSR